MEPRRRRDGSPVVQDDLCAALLVDEQYERLWIVLLDANRFNPQFQVYAVPDFTKPVSLNAAFDELMDL
jgi:hypothetical protein